MKSKSVDNSKQLQDMIVMITTVWLCFSPFTLGFIGNPNASISALLIAVSILLNSQLGLLDRPHTVEWINFVASVTLILSPWLFDYSHLLFALINAEVCAAIIIIFSFLSFHQEDKILKSSSRQHHLT